MARMRFVPAAAAVLLLAAPAAAAAQQDAIALVYRLMLEKQMAVTPQQGTEHFAALGERLRDQDVVQTGSNTRAAIRFADDGSLVRLNPSSQLTIRAEGDRSTLSKTIELEVGTLWAKVTPGQARDFRVQTPSGVAAVKGTEFTVNVTEGGEMSVWVREGSVVLTNLDGSNPLELSSDDYGLITQGGAPQQTEPPPEVVEQFEQLAAEEAGTAEGDRVLVEIQVQAADGRVRTILLELPRSEAAALLGQGR